MSNDAREQNDPTPTTSDEATDLNELNNEGVGGTLGPKDNFEPEESQGKEG